jgi:hypothetical protein
MPSSSAVRPLNFEKSGFDTAEWKILKSLSTPTLIQDYLNKLTFNHEESGETYQSVRRILKSQKAHCFEGALVAAAALWVQGERPLLLDLVTTDDDDDHVVTLFKKENSWGAFSKTNHSVLRYREPIYRDVRELTLSYFNEYFLNDGTKTLRAYSKPFDLSKEGYDWLVGEDELFNLVHKLHNSLHVNILSTTQKKRLRVADLIERKGAEEMEYPKK